VQSRRLSRPADRRPAVTVAAFSRGAEGPVRLLDAGAARQVRGAPGAGPQASHTDAAASTPAATGTRHENPPALASLRVPGEGSAACHLPSTRNCVGRRVLHAVEPPSP